MIITIVVDQYGTTKNGTSVTAQQLAKDLIKKGHEVRILCGKGTGKPEESEESEKIYETGVNKMPILYQICRSQGMLLGRVRKQVIAHACDGADVVHILMMSPLGKAVTRYCDAHGIEKTAAFHVQPENITSTIGLGTFKPVNYFIYTLLRKQYNQFTRIHCPSRMIADQLNSHHYSSEKYVISNGISSQFSPLSVSKPPAFTDKYVILMVGRLSVEKRQELIIDAVKKSKYEGKIQLIFAGQGPRGKALLQRAKGLTNKPIIRYFDRQELIRVINFSDLYVHASDAEIEGISCMEAFSCGLVPVISNSPISATKEHALTAENLFEARNSDSLAQRIDYWMDHTERKNELSKEYVEYAQQFAATLCTQLLEKQVLHIN